MLECARGKTRASPGRCCGSLYPAKILPFFAMALRHQQLAAIAHMRDRANMLAFSS